MYSKELLLVVYNDFLARVNQQFPEVKLAPVEPDWIPMLVHRLDYVEITLSQAVVHLPDPVCMDHPYAFVKLARVCDDYVFTFSVHSPMPRVLVTHQVSADPKIRLGRGVEAAVNSLDLENVQWSKLDRILNLINCQYTTTSDLASGMVEHNGLFAEYFVARYDREHKLLSIHEAESIDTVLQYDRATGETEMSLRDWEPSFHGSPIAVFSWNAEEGEFKLIKSRI